MGESVKCLTKAKKNKIYCFQLISQASRLFIQKIIRLFKCDSTFINLSWSLLITFLSFTCLEMVSMVICSIPFLGTEVGLTSLQFPRSYFLPFLEVWMTFPFFQSSGTSPSGYDHWKVMEIGFAIQSTSSLSTKGCNPSAAVGWWTFISFKCSPTRSSST